MSPARCSRLLHHLLCRCLLSSTLLLITPLPSCRTHAYTHTEVHVSTPTCLSCSCLLLDPDVPAAHALPHVSTHKHTGVSQRALSRHSRGQHRPAYTRAACRPASPRAPAASSSSSVHSCRRVSIGSRCSAASVACCSMLLPCSSRCLSPVRLLARAAAAASSTAAPRWSSCRHVRAVSTRHHVGRTRQQGRQDGQHCTQPQRQRWTQGTKEQLLPATLHHMSMPVRLSARQPLSPAPSNTPDSCLAEPPSTCTTCPAVSTP